MMVFSQKPKRIADNKNSVVVDGLNFLHTS